MSEFKLDIFDRQTGLTVSRKNITSKIHSIDL